MKPKNKTTNLSIKLLGQNCQKLREPHAMEYVVKQYHILGISFRTISKTTYKDKILASAIATVSKFTVLKFWISVYDYIRKYVYLHWSTDSGLNIKYISVNLNYRTVKNLEILSYLAAQLWKLERSSVELKRAKRSWLVHRWVLCIALCSVSLEVLCGEDIRTLSAKVIN